MAPPRTGQRKNFQCPICSKDLYVPPKILQQYPERTHCSLPCRVENQRRQREIRGPYQRQNKVWKRTPNHICPICGKSCYKQPSKLQRDPDATCSSECRWQQKHTQALLHLECLLCHKPIERLKGSHRSEDTQRVFCSVAHFRIWSKMLPGINRLEYDFNRLFPQLEFVGDGALWLEDIQGAMCPDFRLPQTHKLIELYGDYWHRNEDGSLRIQRLNALGYECLIIWESEFRRQPDLVFVKVQSYLELSL